MAKLDLLYDIKNYTPATASTVNENFSTIETHTNQELVERDGTVAMRAQLKLVGDPVADLDAAPKQYVDQIMPIGIIMMFGGAGAPPGGKWMVCNGAELQSSEYPELYGVIGHNFSAAGTPASRFNLPNLQDRMPMGKGTSTSMGEKGGYRDATLPVHHHGLANHTHTMNHNHPAGVTTNAGRHNHGITDGFNLLRDAGGGTVTAGGATKAPMQFNADGDHTHNFNVDNFTGKTGGPTGDLTGDSGADPNDKNLPPFLGVQNIIRVK